MKSKWAALVRYTQAMPQAAAREERPEWIRIVGEAESILGGRWAVMTARHGDWGRDGTMEIVKQIPGLKYAAGAQGIRRFWRKSEVRPELGNFADRMQNRMSIIQI